MLKHVLKLAFVSSVVLYLRNRWQRLAWCAGAILVAAYAHSEYLDYVAALPAGSREAGAAREYVLLSFVLKNTVIGTAILSFIVPELWRFQRRHRRITGRQSIDRTPPEVNQSKRADVAASGDGFDFLRHGHKLSTRNEQVIRDKRSR